MTTIITRRALIAWGQTPTPELASIISHGPGHRQVITWHDVLTQRRQRQDQLLARKRAMREVHAYKLWVAFYDTAFFGGWQAFLDTYTGARVWIDRDRQRLRPILLTVYPLVLALGNPWEREWPAWDGWKGAFAEKYQRRHQAHKPVGVTYVSWDGADDLRHITTPAEQQTTHASHHTCRQEEEHS